MTVAQSEVKHKAGQDGTSFDSNGLAAREVYFALIVVNFFDTLLELSTFMICLSFFRERKRAWAKADGHIQNPHADTAPDTWAA